MAENYVKLTHYCFEDESKEYSTVSVLDDNKKEQVIYQTNEQKIIDELDKVLSLLGDKQVITLSIKQKG